MPDPQLSRDATPTAVRCPRVYVRAAGRLTKCGGPLAPIRRSQHLGCTWCGRVEVSHRRG